MRYSKAEMITLVEYLKTLPGHPCLSNFFQFHLEKGYLENGLNEADDSQDNKNMIRHLKNYLPDAYYALRIPKEELLLYFSIPSSNQENPIAVWRLNL